MIRSILTFFIILLLSGSLYSQKSLEVGIFGGGSYYIGDLNPTKHFLQTDLAYGGVLRYNYNSRWTIRFSVYRGKLNGDDEISKTNLDRMLKFESYINDFSAILELNFLNYITGSTRNFVAPYIFTGISFFTFKPTAEGVNLKDIGTEGQQVIYNGRDPYSLFGFAIPFGFGFKYSLNKRLGIAFEWGMRKTFTDYIDDVSRTYYLDGEAINKNDLDEVLSDPTLKHKPGMERGDPKTKDWYNFTGITLTYKFNLFKNSNCSDFGTRRKY